MIGYVGTYPDGEIKELPCVSGVGEDALARGNHWRCTGIRHAFVGWQQRRVGRFASVVRLCTSWRIGLLQSEWSSYTHGAVNMPRPRERWWSQLWQCMRSRRYGGEYPVQNAAVTYLPQHPPFFQAMCFIKASGVSRIKLSRPELPRNDFLTRCAGVRGMEQVGECARAHAHLFHCHYPEFGAWIHDSGGRRPTRYWG